jgi:hypothetical protein
MSHFPEPRGLCALAQMLVSGIQISLEDDEWLLGSYNHSKTPLAGRPVLALMPRT